MTSNLPGEPVRQGISQRLCRLMAGLDVGISGGVLCLVWLGFHSWLRGEFWWAKFNVAAAIFFGDAVYGMGFGRATLVGIALLLAVYALLGVAFGLLARSHGFARNLLLGLMTAMLWHTLADRFVWRRLDIFAPAYFVSLATLPAHLLLAINFSRFAGRYRALALAFGSPDWSAEFAAVPAAEPEVVQAPESPEPIESPGALEIGAIPDDPPGSEAAENPSPPPPTLATLLLPAPRESAAPPPPDDQSDKTSQKGSSSQIVE